MDKDFIQDPCRNPADMVRRWWNTAIIVRACLLGLPLMVATIGGETRSSRPLIDLYRVAWRQGDHSHDQLKVGIHSLGYVAQSTQEAVDDFFPGYARTLTRSRKDRGWHNVTRTGLEVQRGAQGELLVEDPEEIVEKVF